MITSKGNILVFTMSLVLMTQWIDSPLMVGGKPIVFISELVLYLHTAILLVMTNGKLILPERIIKFLLPLIVYFILHLVYSAFFADFGNALLTTRRLVYYPFVALAVGYSTAVVIKNDTLADKALSSVLYLTLPLILLNVVLRFHMFQEFGFVSRATGVILASILFGKMIDLIRYNRLSKRDAWISTLTFLYIFITSSRGVYLAFICTTMLLLWQSRSKIGVLRFTKLAVGGVAGILIVAVIALSSPLVIKTLEKFGSDIVSVSEGDLGSHGDDFNTLGARYYLYRSAFDLGMESPLFGMGSGYKVDSWYIGGQYDIQRSKTAHNYYLDIWYRLGLVGVSLFFLFYFNVLGWLKKSNLKVYYMLIMALTYSLFDVVLSSTVSAIIPIFMLVGSAMFVPPIQKAGGQ